MKQGFGIRDSGVGKALATRAPAARAAAFAFPNPESPIPNPVASAGGEP